MELNQKSRCWGYNRTRTIHTRTCCTNTPLPHLHPVYTKPKEAWKKEERKKSRWSRGRERCYDRNEKPTHVHINVLHSTMSPSHRKKGSIYRQHSSLSVPSCSVSGKQVVFPFQGFSLWRILLIYRRDPQLHFTLQCFSRCMRCQRAL